MNTISDRANIIKIVQKTKDLAIVTLQNKTNQPISVTIPVGSLNTPQTPGKQDCVVMENKTIKLGPLQTIDIEVIIACYNRGFDPPNNVQYNPTNTIDNNIKPGMSQKNVWDHVQDTIKKNSIKKNTADYINRMKEASQKVFKKLMEKQIKIHSADVVGSNIQIKIDDPRQKRLNWVTSQSNMLAKQKLREAQQYIGKDYLPGNVVRTPQGKLIIRYPLNKDQYFQRIDLVTSKDQLKKVIDLA